VQALGGRSMTLKMVWYLLEYQILRLVLFVLRIPQESQKGFSKEETALLQRRVKELVPIVPLSHPLPLYRRLWLHLQGFFLVVRDIPAMQRRKLRKDDEDLSPEQRRTPGMKPYYLKNYHYQTDGYFSLQSARRYDVQIELVFLGLAQKVRHAAAAALTKFLPQGGSYKMLECGAGTGDLGAWLQGIYPASDILITDPSVQYLRWAQTKYPKLQFRFEPTFIEELSFCPSSSLDALCAGFIFHEIPQDDARKGLAEAFRVLKPGSYLMTFDAAQRQDGAENAFALDLFERAYYEPYYKQYRDGSIDDELRSAGFSVVHQQMLLFSRMVIARKG
jgi:ubiquinone/menaquinone biosynthesis C-methylase UbiE